MGRDDGTDSAAALCIGMLSKALIRNVFLLAQCNEGSHALTIPCIRLVAGCFQNKSAVHDRIVGDILSAWINRMVGVSDINRKHQAV